VTLVKNIYGHPYTPTIGRVMAPGDVADIGLYAQELDAIATGYLLVMDPSWVPPDEPPPPPVSGGGGVGNARVLLWDSGAGAYDHPEWWADTAYPREFRGPNDPSAEPGITLAFADTWETTEAP
jgi:hypothetical protein